MVRAVSSQGAGALQISSRGAFPGHDAGHFVRLSVASQSAVAYNFLSGASGANTLEGNTQAISHSVLLGQAQDLVARVAEVSNTSQGDAEAFGGSHGLVEAAGAIVVGVDVLGTSVGLKGGGGQARQANSIVSAVHGEGHGINSKDAASVGNGVSSVDRGCGVDGGCRGEVGDQGILDRDDVEIIAKGRAEIGHR